MTLVLTGSQVSLDHDKICCFIRIHNFTSRSNNIFNVTGIDSVLGFHF